MDEYKSRLATYLTGLVREELEKYVGGYTDEWNDQRKKNAEVLGYKLAGTSDISEEIIDWQGKYDDEFKFKKGQLIKDINPDCPHHGSEGEVTKVTKDEVTYTVRNNGKTYKVGDELTKTKEQLTPLSINESINEKMGPEQYHRYMQYVFDTQFKTPEEKKMKKSIIKKINKAQKKKGLPLFKESINEYHKFRGKMTYGDKGIGEEGMYFFVDQLINAMEDVDEREFVSHMSKELGIDKKVMGRIWKNYDKVHPSLRYKWRPRQWEKWLNKQGITEDKKRDYKAEYKKFQSSTKAKKYRAELNQYNRKKGTYGNNDGKDASHKGGKIVGFEKESTNRGRREKSRLKKEDIREFSGEQGINVYLGGIVDAMRKAGLKAKTAKQMKHGFSKSKDKIGFFIDVEQRGFDRKEMYTLQVEIDRDGNLWYLSGHRPMKLGKWADTSKIVRMWKALNKVKAFGQDAIFKKR